MVLRTINNIEFQVDKEDFKLIRFCRFYFHPNVGRITAYDTNTKKREFLHRLIMDTPKNREIDHINHNIFDNRKENLRICTAKENHRNTLMHRTNKTGYKGVSFASNMVSRPFEAKIRVNGVKKFLGYFMSARSAAFAYNIAARHYFGEFALLNS